MSRGGITFRRCAPVVCLLAGTASAVAGCLIPESDFQPSGMVDDKGPAAVTITAPAARINSQLTISFTGAEDGATYMCHFDSPSTPFVCGASGSTPPPDIMSQLAFNVAHTLTITGTDRFSHVGLDATKSFFMDTLPPLIDVSAPQGDFSGTNFPNFTLAFQVTDAG